MDPDPDPAEEAAIEALAAAADPTGGWAYRPGGTPQVEPTALALLALSRRSGRENRFASAVAATGSAALRTWQAADGSFPVRGGPDGAAWPTAVALVALNADPDAPEDARRRAVAWLLETSGKTVPPKPGAPVVTEIDTTIPGWPWTAGSFSWLDPTAWACLALRQAGHGDHARVRDGLRLVLDRAFDEGGANAGNRRVFGSRSAPVPANTASLLLAFAGPDDHPRLAAARRFLLATAAADPDLENLCWARIALVAWREAPGVAAALPALAERVREAHSARRRDAVFGVSVVREALAVLALAVDEDHALLATRVRLFADPPRVPLRSGVAAECRDHPAEAGVGAAPALPRPAPPDPAVHIARAAGYGEDLVAVLERQYAAFRDAVPLRGRQVVLKPNLVEHHPEKPVTTHPALVGAAVLWCRAEGAREVIVAEGPGHWRNAEAIVEASGLGAVLRRLGARFVDLNHDDPVAVPNAGGLTRLDRLHLPRTVVEADVLVSMPKLKTHHWAGVTLSLKNLFGLLPGIGYGWPKNELHWRGIPNSIVDIALTRPPDLALVDGIVGMEGDGPLAGEPRPLGALVMGRDALAVDATCCRLMGFDPEKVGHLKLAELFGVGRLREDFIPQLGARVAEVALPFRPHPRFTGLRAGGRTEGGGPAPAGPADGGLGMLP